MGPVKPMGRKSAFNNIMISWLGCKIKPFLLLCEFSRIRSNSPKKRGLSVRVSTLI